MEKNNHRYKITCFEDEVGRKNAPYIFGFFAMISPKIINTMNIISQALSSVDLKVPTAVAVSGGIDSMCLLHAVAQTARLFGQPLWAFHIHHDLQADADTWQAHVCEAAQKSGAIFDTRRLDAATREPAQSVEDWARRGRYQTLSELAQKHGVQQIVLAHHQDDQIETYLLQTQRGAGVRGQSAMPERMVRNGIHWLRPWLDVPKHIIIDYSKQHCIYYINDPSNDDERFSRNAIRAQLARQPLSAEQRQTLLDTIHQAQREHAEHSEWAQQELALYRVTHRGDIGECGRLYGINLVSYTLEQAQLLLREWMATMGWRMPSRASLDELLKQLTQPANNRKMCWRHPDGWGITQLKNNWIAAKLLPQGQWFLTPSLQQRIQAERFTVRPRMGGETFRLAINRPHISLKHAYQMYEIAPMLREQLPLLYNDKHLVHVVGVGDVVDAQPIL